MIRPPEPVVVPPERIVAGTLDYIALLEGIEDPQDSRFSDGAKYALKRVREYIEGLRSVGPQA